MISAYRIRLGITQNPVRIVCSRGKRTWGRTSVFMQCDIESPNTLEHHDAKRSKIRVAIHLRRGHKVIPQPAKVMLEGFQSIFDVKAANQFQGLRGRFTNVASVIA